MIYLFPVLGPESGCPVGHQPLALEGPDGGAEIGVVVHTVHTSFFLALRSVAWDDHVSHSYPADPFPHAFDHSGRLVAQDTGPVRAWAGTPVPLVDVSVAEGIGKDLETHLSFFGRVDQDGLNLESFLGAVGDGGFALDGLRCLHE